MAKKIKKQPNILDLIFEKYDDMEFLKADGLDDAVIGVDEREYRLIYSIEKCIELLSAQMEITEEDLDETEKEEGVTLEDKKYELASEYFYYNTLGAYVGEKTPIYTYTNFE